MRNKNTAPTLSPIKVWTGFRLGLGGFLIGEGRMLLGQVLSLGEWGKRPAGPVLSSGSISFLFQIFYKMQITLNSNEIRTSNDFYLQNKI
jgi:hypothetical protein